MQHNFPSIKSYLNSSRAIGWLLLVGLLASPGLRAQSFINKTTANGLGNNTVYGIYAVGNTVYAATAGGLSISTDEGNTFTNKTTANGLGDNYEYKVYVVGSTVYAATNGLSISTDGGNTFTTKTTANGLGDNSVKGVYAVGSTVYAATAGGLSISTDGGNTFANKTTANGLGSNAVVDVYAVGSTVYAATGGGLSISTDGGNTFTNKTTANGLSRNSINGVYAVGNTIYVATGGGLAISTDGGNTFTNKTTTNGLGDPNVNGVYAVGNTVYAATAGGLSISTDGGNTFTNKTSTNGLGSNFAYAVYAVGGTIYVATGNGLSISSSPLPVRLSFFSGRATPTGIQLEWQTLAETSNAGFTLLRGSTPLGLEAIASIPSLAPTGSANSSLSYRYLDGQPLAGLSYYQLRQTDFDGSQHLSNVIAVRADVIRPILYPNPVSNSELLTLEPAQAYERYELLDASGKVIQAVEQEGILTQLRLPAGLPKGHYVLRVYQNQSPVQLYRLVH